MIIQIQFPDEPVVLPHGLDPLLEQGVVAAGGQPAGQLDVVVQGPEVLSLRKIHVSLFILNYQA